VKNIRLPSWVAYIVRNTLSVVGGRVASNVHLDEASLGVLSTEDAGLVHDCAHKVAIGSGADGQVIDRGHSDNTLRGGQLKRNIALR
jgi:hypothetical protein